MTSEVKLFRSISARYLDEAHALFPQEASELGLHQFDAQLGQNDPSLHERHNRLMGVTLAEVETLADSAFTGDDWLDRRGFLSMLRTGLFHNATHARWRDNPQRHCDAAIQAIFSLVVRHSDDLGAVRSAIESRLSSLPRFLDAGLECVRKPIPLWTKLAVKSCDGAVPFLTEVRGNLLPLSSDPAKTERLFGDAISAFGNYARGIQRKAPGRANGYAIGENGFEFLIRERLGLPYSVREAEALGRRLISQLTGELKQEAKRFGRKSAAEIIEAAAAEWTPSEGSLLEEYDRVTREMRRRFENSGAVTLPKDERLRVMLVPPFLRHQFPTAAYLQPGPYERKQDGVFWVNDLSATQTDPARRAAEIRQHFGLELTCAHEGYPGHHVQFVVQNRHRSKLRRLFAHAIFYEGWTLWCEKMCLEQRIYESPYARLMQLNDALWRAYRIVIDCGLHSGSLSFGGACQLLMDGVGFTRRRAEGDVNWYTSAPSVPMSYLLGRLEVEKLHARMTREGGWTLQQFNDWVLSFGAIPWSWIWESQLRR